MIPPLVTYHPATATADQRIPFTELPCPMECLPAEGSSPASYVCNVHASAKSAFFAKCLITPEQSWSRITEKAAKIFDIDFVPNQPHTNFVMLTPHFSCDGKRYAFSHAGYVTSRELPHGAHMQLGKSFMEQFRITIDSAHTLCFLRSELPNSDSPEFHDTYTFSEQDIRDRINFCFSARQKLLKQP